MTQKKASNNSTKNQQSRYDKRVIIEISDDDSEEEGDVEDEGDVEEEDTNVELSQFTEKDGFAEENYENFRLSPIFTEGNDVGDVEGEDDFESSGSIIAAPDQPLTFVNESMDYESVSLVKEKILAMYYLILNNENYKSPDVISLNSHAVQYLNRIEDLELIYGTYSFTLASMLIFLKLMWWFYNSETESMETDIKSKLDNLGINQEVNENKTGDDERRTDARIIAVRNYLLFPVQRKFDQLVIHTKYNTLSEIQKKKFQVLSDILVELHSRYSIMRLKNKNEALIKQYSEEYMRDSLNEENRVLPSTTGFLASTCFTTKTGQVYLYLNLVSGKLAIMKDENNKHLGVVPSPRAFTQQVQNINHLTNMNQFLSSNFPDEKDLVGDSSTNYTYSVLRSKEDIHLANIGDRSKENEGYLVMKNSAAVEYYNNQSFLPSHCQRNQIMVGGPFFSEGISLYDTEVVHLIDFPLSVIDAEQAIARVVRLNSNKPNTNIIVEVYSTKTKSNNITKIDSVETFIYNTYKDQAVSVRKVYDYLIKYAMDRFMNHSLYRKKYYDEEIFRDHTVPKIQIINRTKKRGPYDIINNGSIKKHIEEKNIGFVTYDNVFIPFTDGMRAVYQGIIFHQPPPKLVKTMLFVEEPNIFNLSEVGLFDSQALYIIRSGVQDICQAMKNGSNSQDIDHLLDDIEQKIHKLPRFQPSDENEFSWFTKYLEPNMEKGELEKIQAGLKKIQNAQIKLYKNIIHNKDNYVQFEHSVDGKENLLQTLTVLFNNLIANYDQYLFGGQLKTLLSIRKEKIVVAFDSSSDNESLGSTNSDGEITINIRVHVEFFNNSLKKEKDSSSSNVLDYYFYVNGQKVNLIESFIMTFNHEYVHRVVDLMCPTYPSENVGHGCPFSILLFRWFKDNYFLAREGSKTEPLKNVSFEHFDTSYMDMKEEEFKKGDREELLFFIDDIQERTALDVYVYKTYMVGEVCDILCKETDLPLFLNYMNTATQRISKQYCWGFTSIKYKKENYKIVPLVPFHRLKWKKERAVMSHKHTRGFNYLPMIPYLELLRKNKTNFQNLIKSSSFFSNWSFPET